jgi:hypothetical protein
MGLEKITGETGESTGRRSNGARSNTYAGGSSEFDKLCRDRRAAGIKQYRGGDPYAPFVGDPIKEVEEEIADAVIYTQEAALQGKIHPEVAFDVDAHLRRALATLWDGLRRG